MSAHLAFWTAAWIDLGAVALLALLGRQQIRRGAWRAHRRSMLAATTLVGLFLVAYLLKVWLVGHEDLSAWSPMQIWVLRIHEVGIAAMLGGGLYAGWRAFRFRASLPAGPQLPAHDEGSPGRAGHRWAGRVAVAGAVLAWLSAAGMLAGMFAG